MKIKRKLSIIILVTFFINGCGMQTYNISQIASPDISCSSRSYDTIAHITINDTYTLNGQKYYTIFFELDKPKTEDTSYLMVGDFKLYSYEDIAYQSPAFDISEEEYEKYFGIENDAFYTTVYELHCEAPILEYSRWSYFNDLNINSDINDKTYIELDKEKWANDNAAVIIKDMKMAKAYLNRYRFSVFGEHDFTMEEIEDTQKKLVSIGKNFITRYTK